jgi:CheY-like chemotaxis protein
MLTSLGHKVVQAVDGCDFLRALNINDKESTEPSNLSSFDVVLMDDNMPNMSGPEATLIARKHGYKGLIYGVTGNIEKSQVSFFLECGANEVFSKPLDLIKLKESIVQNLILP